jgi:2-deoxy-D-gluconate 3-dehydrogenase
VSPFSLAGKTALVTGANTGIGQAIALAMGRAGRTLSAPGVNPAPRP